MTDTADIPVIAIDGPSGSGKGTIARRVALALGWHLLDSGALYRLVALAAGRKDIALDDEKSLALLAVNLNVRFDSDQDGKACGECDSCKYRIKGFTEAGVPDPTIYASINSKTLKG
ncbi:MAG: (d)CMP kinase [Proteobacteria bacterium]|nr:(d)CMP kinase [Pseudomonadota bacterium]